MNYYFLKYLFIIFMAFSCQLIHAQENNTICGNVYDDLGNPLIGANIYIYGSTEGDITDSIGHFSFITSQQGDVILKCSFVGYANYQCKLCLPLKSNLNIRLKSVSVNLKNVQIVASSFSFGQTNKLKTMKPLDVVMSGNSCGDIIASLHSLPGVQTVGENGKLYVRGGDNSETQIFINDMHVLQPYDTEPSNTVTRSRFSPFLFKGINFSLGGYSS
jgi:hypothetical protein